MSKFYSYSDFRADCLPQLSKNLSVQVKKTCRLVGMSFHEFAGACGLDPVYLREVLAGLEVPSATCFLWISHVCVRLADDYVERVRASFG